jgi:hypothetical protein
MGGPDIEVGDIEAIQDDRDVEFWAQQVPLATTREGNVKRPSRPSLMNMQS